MPAVGRRRQRQRTPLATVTRARRSVVVELPEAPGSLHRPAPLVLPLTRGRPVWQRPDDPTTVAGFAVLLAVLDLAPPGALLSLAGAAPEHALLAAVYSTRLVRVVAADGLVAHAARQAAATNALPLVVEERAVAGGRPADRSAPTLDDYATTTGLEPAVLHLGAGTEVGPALRGAARVLGESRPWVVVTGGPDADPRLEKTPQSIAQGYEMITDTDVAGASGVYVLTPEAPSAALADRVLTWAGTLTGAAADRSAGLDPPTRQGDPVPAGGPPAGVDLRNPRSVAGPSR